MPITSLEIKDKTFGTRFRGFDPEEVDEFLDIVVRDYEDLVRANHDKNLRIKSLEERLSYFDEMKDSLSQSVLIAQDTAERVKQAAHERSNNIIHQAEQDAQRLLEEAKYKANEILRQATDNAKKVAVETEELKNKSRVFHQRLKSTIESQLAIVESSDWEDILRPTATYLQTSDEAFKEVVSEVLGESVLQQHPEEEPIDMTRQFSQAEMAELQARIEAANKELAEFEAQAKQEAEDPTPVVSPQMEEEPAHPVGPMYEEPEVAPVHPTGPTPATETFDSAPGFEAPQESVTIL
ncbi:DivIVA domain-containing protein [Streptococcus pneumoniae]|uniref:DivIVA domain-containing protein n=1 Tax=Streptococcus pneumoniae TaxID=1313 RepID=UPI0005E4229D|nr:DivIVA domain-containing protein [Streptococcus pneumoniae]CJH78444.1 cell division protein DivIVA [Streptococcus pneumoniae]CJS40284.1 cell division protein DivIVA [Streptococcus pneumoniae]CJV13872.1 cell division protein DivIVA [Streptococcus pneumoniae]CJW57726.1 cell division protein DivIVA [Streptococcus pneumoniae]CJX38064.1 cell division protein DivIVA [Streptococcus pneumoniae]